MAETGQSGHRENWPGQDEAGLEQEQDCKEDETRKAERQGKTRFRQGKVRKSSGKADKVRYGARAGTQN